MDIRDASDYTLIAELERRKFFSRLARVLEAKELSMPFIPPAHDPFATPPKPPLGQFIPGTDRKLPAGARSVVEIPDRSNKDGSQLRMITVAGPGAVEEEKPQFILKGTQREELAQSFIDQWKEEIAILTTRLEREVLSQEEISAIWDEINRLQGQISLRASSAFGAMGIEEVRSRNESLNGAGSVLDAKSEAGVAGRGVQIESVTGIGDIDIPSTMGLPLAERCSHTCTSLRSAIQWDPFILHLPQPVVRLNGPHFEFTASPLVIWRLLVHLQTLCSASRTKLRDSEVATALAEVWNDYTAAGWPVIDLDNPDPAAAFQSGWTSLLMSRMRTTPSEEQRQGCKRTIRIFNVDFQEQEAPDFMFEEGTDGANPEGRHLRPHVTPRQAWTEVQEGPGVFRMKRREPLDHNDPDEEAQ